MKGTIAKPLLDDDAVLGESWDVDAALGDSQESGTGGTATKELLLQDGQEMMFKTLQMQAHCSAEASEQVYTQKSVTLDVLCMTDYTCFVAKAGLLFAHIQTLQALSHIPKLLQELPDDSRQPGTLSVHRGREQTHLGRMYCLEGEHQLAMTQQGVGRL